MFNKLKVNIKESYAGIFISLCLSFMLFFYEPLNLYSSNIGDFWFDINILFPIIIVWFLLAFLLLSLFFIIVRMINKKVYAFFIFCFLVGTICTYIQGNFLIGSLPSIDGEWINFDTFKTEKIISIILWIVVLGILLFTLWKFKFRIIEKTSMYASLVIILMLSSSFIAILTKDGFFESKGKLVPTIENLNVMSSDKNLIVFLLDSVDSKTFEQELEKSGKKETLLKDFTYYPDTLSGYPFTRNSVPLILSGKWYENERSYSKYYTEVIDESPLFEELENQDFDLNLYEFDLNEYKGDNYDRFQNIKQEFSFDNFQIAKELMKLIMYKYLPYQLKWMARIDTINFGGTRILDDDMFFSSNRRFYDAVLSNDIETVENKNFKFIHIEGAHVPYVYDENLNTIENGTYEQSNDACITIIEAYLNKLKESSSYDNSAIVILSDHGYGDGTKGTNRQNPILYIKGINEHHDYKTSDVKVSYADMVTVFLRLAEGKASDEELFEGINRLTRRYMFYLYDDPSVITEYETNGNAWDSSALKETGKKYVLK